MNMSERPEKKKARLRYDNVLKTTWTDEVHKGLNNLDLYSFIRRRNLQEY
jgi:hypothetical protein